MNYLIRSLLTLGVLTCGSYASAAPPAKPNAQANPRAAQKASAAKPVAKPVAAKPAAAKPAAKPIAKAPAKPAPAKADAGRGAETLYWVKSLPGWTRSLRAAPTVASAPWAETLALAVDGQYLVVPWNFISDLWLSQSNTHFFVEEREVQLVDVDLAANLALFRSSEALVPSFSRGSVRRDAPGQDEALLILSTRDWLRPGGRYLRSTGDSGLVRYQIATGTPELKTARYVFDKFGRLVAVVPTSEGDKSWSSSGQGVFQILSRQDGPKPASIGGPEQKRRQLFYWQDKLTNLISPTRNVVSTPSMDCENALVSVNDKSLAAQVSRVNARKCSSRVPIALGGGYSTGVQMWTADATLRSGESDNGTRLTKSISEELFTEFDKSASYVNLMTVPECNENFVSNSQGQPVKVRFCTSALKVEPGLSDTAVAVSSLDGNRAFITMARLKGFNQVNTRRLLEAMIETVRSSK